MAVDTVEAAEALAVAREAASDAVVVLRRGAVGNPSEVDAKRPRDFVTQTDREAERAIVDRIAGVFPDHAVLGEEFGRRAGDGDREWVIDPLDGTTNFVHGFPVYAVSIAFVAAGRPAAAVVVDPVRGEWFTAQSGDGAWVDSGDAATRRRIEVAPSRSKERRLLATGFPFRHPDHVDRYLAAFRSLFAHVGDMRRAGSAAIDLAYVAAGRVDGFWELGLNWWDMAAGALLVTEAGGKVSDWTGADRYPSTGWIAAGSPEVHAMLVDVLTPFSP